MEKKLEKSVFTVQYRRVKAELEAIRHRFTQIAGWAEVYKTNQSQKTLFVPLIEKLRTRPKEFCETVLKNISQYERTTGNEVK